jgi:long-chain acyl-CoA synthetase
MKNEFFNIIDIMEAANKEYSENNVIKTATENITYSQLYTSICLFSDFLRKMCGNRVKIALVAPNGYIWIKGFFSIINSDNVAIPIDHGLNYEKLIEILKEFHIRVILIDPSIVDEEIIRKIKLEGIYVINAQNFVAEDLRLAENDRIEERECSAIYFTSGTTGKYKAVMISQRNLIQNCISIDSILRFKRECVLLNVLPFHHSFAFMCDVIYAMYLGATICISDLKNFEQNLVAYSPDYLFVVPLIAENILKYLKIKQRENSDCINIKNMVVGRRLKNIICGGSIIRQGLRKELYDFGIELIKGYGITECSPVISIEAWNEDEDDLTVGIPLKCNTVKVVDHEILVKGDNVTRGYYLNQNDNETAFLDGWFKTGDLGFVGDNNKLYINGRKKNLVILENGNNISVETIESEITNKGIEIDFIVFEEIDEKGEHYLALLIEKGALPFEDNIEKFLRWINTQNEFKIKKLYELDGNFVKTATQKIKRKENIEQYVRSILINRISEILEVFLYQKKKIYQDMDLYTDLGLDSMELLRLTLSIEKKFNIEIKLEEIKKFGTIKDMIDYLIEEHVHIDDIVVQWKIN